MRLNTDLSQERKRNEEEMKKEARIKDWERIFKLVTDPEEMAKVRRDEERRQRIEMRKKDTGL